MPLRAIALRALSVLTLASGCGREPEVVTLWPNGAPGSEAHRAEPEVANDWWVANVHQPTLTVFRAEPARSTGAAMVVLPGGGHKVLVFGPEGLDPARLLAKRGVTSFVLKYRLAHAEHSPYRVEEHARVDVLRALRWVRQHAKRYRVDPSRVGVMGFSAGGELASLVSYGPTAGDPAARDAIDRLDARPNFQVVIYPGPLGVPEVLAEDAPAAFFLAANDDPVPAQTVLRLTALYRQSGLPVELHLLARGGHGFNLGQRSRLRAVRTWPARLVEWLEASALVRSR